MLPENFISSVPPPEKAISETGLQFPWQTPSRWTYPARLTTQDQNVLIPPDPNESTGGIPDIADEECLKRTNIPWNKKKGTKVYLRVLEHMFQLNLRPLHMVTFLETMSLSNIFMKSLHRMVFFKLSDNSVGPGEPVKMDGEISVVRAEPGSREMKRNEIGVEFEIKLSDQEVFESVWMRKVGNGTVVLEVLLNLIRIINLNRQMEVHINKQAHASKHISLSQFLLAL